MGFNLFTIINMLLKIKWVLVFFLFLGLGVYLYQNVLPYKLSSQTPLNLENLTGEYDRTDEAGIFLGQNVSSYLIPEPKKLAQVLGTDSDNKRIEVDLTNQKLYAFEGDQKVYEFLVSTGKWSPTPTGIFRIWIKLRSTKMSGGSKALNTYYYLPNVPFVMYFANDQIPSWRGYGLHGTYWHSNFGHPMSHGCVNLRIEDAEKLYYWTTPDLQGKNMTKATPDNPGTPIIIYGETPKE